MNILLITETLHAGGAETFVVRLANALSAGHRVWLLNIHPELSRPELMASLRPELNLVNFRQSAKQLKQKLDGLLFRLGIDHSFRQPGIVGAICDLVREHRIDVVHSHLFKADYYVSEARARGLRFRHVSTNHGDYLLYRSRQPSQMLAYEQKLVRTLRSLDAMVNISDEQLAQFNDFRRQRNPELQVCKILNGFEAAAPEAVSRQSVGLRPEHLVFGMVARGIPEKGWELLINAFRSVNLPEARLLLVGEGPEIERLRVVHAADHRIVFAGYTANTLGFIRLFDVGVLPSYYKAESLPTVIIEYLHEGKPVLASDIGEVRHMLDTGTGASAGVLIPLGPPGDMQAPLEAALRDLHQDAGLRKGLSALAPAAFRKFSMDTCLRHYEAVYSGAAI